MNFQGLFSDLVRVETRLWNLLEARLQAELDLTLGRFETMTVIGSRGRCRAQDVADELGITISGASKLLARTEAVGHCARTANPDDGRSSLVELTERGRAVLKQGRRIVDDELATTLDAALDPDAITALSTALSALKLSIHPTDDTRGT